jgi:2-iminobutanoate/2-iminopropanoate deaminase
MSRTVISTTSAPAAVGPYSQAISANGFLYTAGQIPLVPSEGKLVDGDIQAQTRQVLENLKAVLEAAGTDFSHVVKTTVFMTNLDDFAQMNAIYATYFPANPPARSTVQVVRLPYGAQVEIEVVALLPG